MAIVDELVTILGFEVDDSGAKDFEKGLESVKQGAKKVVIAVTAAAAAASAWAVSAAKGADESLKFARGIGVSFEALQELEFAAERAGAGADGLRSLLEKLPTLGLSGATGIAVLADEFKGLSASQALVKGQALGISEKQIRLLKLGSSGIKSLRSEAQKLGGVISADQASKAEEFVDSMTNVKFAISGFAKNLGIEFIPVANEIITGLTGFITANSDLIKTGLSAFVEGIVGGFKLFASAIGLVKDAIMKVVPVFDFFIGKAGAVKIITAVVTGALLILAAAAARTATLMTFAAIKMAASWAFAGASAVKSLALITLGLLTNTKATIAAGVAATRTGIRMAAAWLLAVAPVALVVAGIVAVGLALDDLITFFRGGDSVIGRFLDTMQESFPKTFGLIKSVIMALISPLQTISDLFDTIIGFVAKFGGAALEKILPSFGKADEGIEGARTSPSLSNFEEIGKNLNFAQGISAPVPANISNVANRQQTANNTIVINGAGSPESVANEVIRRGSFGEFQRVNGAGVIL